MRATGTSPEILHCVQNDELILMFWLGRKRKFLLKDFPNRMVRRGDRSSLTSRQARRGKEGKRKMKKFLEVVVIFVRSLFGFNEKEIELPCTLSVCKDKKTVITLPSREVMLERLRKVSTAPLVEQYFYPVLLECAGLEKSPVELVAMLVHANRMFSLWASGREAGFDEYVDVLVDDEQAAEEVKAVPHLTRLNLAGGGNPRFHFHP